MKMDQSITASRSTMGQDAKKWRVSWRNLHNS
jgi:hypothetical protein